MKRLIPLTLSIFMAMIAISASYFQKTGLVQNTTVTATAGGTTTLVATSNQVHILTGSTTQTLKLPPGSELFNGWGYYVSNESSGTVTVVDSGNTTLFTMGEGTWAHIYLSSNVGDTGNWRYRVGTQESSIDINNLQGLGTDFAPQYLNVTRGDARYFPQTDFIDSFTGFGGEPVKTTVDGFIDSSLLSPSVGTGDVVGPSGATDNAVPRFNGTSGKIIQNSLVTVNDTGDTTIPGSLFVATDTIFASATSGMVGFGNAAPAARVDIIGTTSDDTGFSILAENSTAVPLFKVRNDGLAFLGPDQDTAGLDYYNLTVAHNVNRDEGIALFNNSTGVNASINVSFTTDDFAGFASSYIGQAGPLNTQYGNLIQNRFYLYAGADTDGAMFITEGNDPFIFATQLTERMRVSGTGEVGIGTSSPGSRLHVAGAYQGAVTPVTTGTTLDGTHQYVTVDTTSGSVTITFPDCVASILGRTYHVKKIAAANTLNIARTGSSDTFDGATSLSWTEQYQSRTFVCASTTLWAIF